MRNAQIFFTDRTTKRVLEIHVFDFKVGCASRAFWVSRFHFHVDSLSLFVPLVGVCSKPDH